MTNELQKIKADLIAELDKRIADKIIEQTNADLLKKLITSAETINEAIMIAELGTTYKRTGFHFDKRLEKMTDTIKYFKKNEKLSFVQDPNALTNKLIIGDNYDALLNLLIQYRGKIDVIYIDPPYGKDAMGEFAQTNYDNAITRDNLLSMLYPRLVLARQLLCDNGVIFCSIDDKNQAYVKGLFDEVFGEANFVTNIIWEKKYSPQNDAKWFSDNHDFILTYARNKEIWRPKLLSRSDEMNARYKNPDNDPRGLWKSSDLSVKTYSANYDYPIQTPSGKIVNPPAGRCWRTSKENLEELIKDNRVWFGPRGDSVPSIKRFLTEVRQGITPLTIWKYTEVGHNQTATQNLKDILGSINFDNPKPSTLIRRLVEIASCENTIILDFFAGSGTTGQAVLELNKQDGGKRQFILVNVNEITDTTPNGIVYDVTSKRLKRVMTGECYDGTRDFKWNEKNQPLGGNLDVYDIATVANFEATEGSTPFEVIDETLYGQEKLGVQEKIQWVCEHFEHTQKKLSEE
jgi:adenine-specific DNA-methyltransferase